MIKDIIPLERDEQKQLIKYLRLKNIFHFAPMNENQHSKANRTMAIRIEAKAKSMGKIKGTSDIVIMLPKKVLFIELKRIKGSITSKEQKEFILKVNKYPYAEGRICKGANEAINFIEEYID